MVASAVSHFSRRSAIRETWGSSQGTSKLRSKVIFLLGKAKDRREQAQVDTESQSHADVLQEDFVVSSPDQLLIKTNWKCDLIMRSFITAGLLPQPDPEDSDGIKVGQDVLPEGQLHHED